MAIGPLSGSPVAGATSAPRSATASFKSVLSQHTTPRPQPHAAHSPSLPQQSPAPVATRVVEGLDAAQRRLDSVLAMARSGATFTPAQLLSLQADVYSSSQQIDLAGKLVEKATGGVKQVLQTQL